MGCTLTVLYLEKNQGLIVRGYWTIQFLYLIVSLIIGSTKIRGCFLSGGEGMKRERGCENVNVI